MGNEHNSAELQRALRIWRRHAGERRLSVPPKGNTTISGITFSGPIAATHHENAIAAIWALVSDRDRKLGEALCRVLVERGDLRGGSPALDVYADGLQAAGDPLGEVLALESTWEWERLDQLDYMGRLTTLVSVATKMRPVVITYDWLARLVSAAIHERSIKAANTIIDQVAAIRCLGEEHGNLGHEFDENSWTVTDARFSTPSEHGIVRATIELQTVGPEVFSAISSFRQRSPHECILAIDLPSYGYGSVASISLQHGTYR
jgi:hypothetical protein